MNPVEDIVLKAKLLVANYKEGGDDGFDHTVTSAGKKVKGLGRFQHLR
jgi:hypothetical protein